MTQDEIIIATVISNIVALVLLLLSWKRKNIARILFSILFICAAVLNWKTVHTDPLVYLEYSKYAIPFYAGIIKGEFARHITGYVSCIALGQLLIGFGLLARDIIVKLSCMGGIIFLLAIAPLGTGSAFPFSITSAAALFILYQKHFNKNILQNKWWV